MRKNAKKHILTALVLCNLAFVWGNSLMTGTDSGELSGGIVEWLGQFLPLLATETGHNLIRKAAHFSEFCLLGLLTGGQRLASEKALKPGLAGFGLAVACIDETIQIFVPGRGSGLLDVWIDAAGFAVGLFMLAIGHTLIKRKKQGE